MFFIAFIFSIIYTFLILNSRSVIWEFCLTFTHHSQICDLGRCCFPILVLNCYIFVIFLGWSFFSLFLHPMQVHLFKLSSIFSTLTKGPSWKNDDEQVGSLSGEEKKFSSLSFISFWTYVHYFHKTIFGHIFICFAPGKQVFIILQLYSLLHVNIFCFPE